MKFQLECPHQPGGDQPRAIASLVQGLRAGRKHQVLHGITGSGKTCTIANVIQQMQRPSVIISPNKTLADQLYHEFLCLFPHNAVRHFVSDYLVFQPQTYVPSRDTYFGKRAALDEVLTHKRNAAAMSALSRRDTIVVVSVSCIFDIGPPQVCRDLSLSLAVGAAADVESIVARLVRIAYRQADATLAPKTFRVRGPYIEVFPLYEEHSYRIEVQDGRVQAILAIDPQSGDTVGQHDSITVYPARLHLLHDGWVEAAMSEIQEELDGRLQEFQRQGKLLDAQRLEAATLDDLENLRKYGWCRGMENYCRALNRRSPGAPPDTLLTYFPDDFLVFIDESHVTVPQIGGMHAGNLGRMQDLVDHGFRLPSAMDSRPLTRAEFEAKVGQVVYVSATPGPCEVQKTGGAVVAQVIRPTGLLDPEIEVMPSDGRMEHLLGEIRERVAVEERVLVTTLTKTSAEEVAIYLSAQGICCRWLHDGLDTNERVEVLDALRHGDIDVLVGINLLREGIDLPQVSLVAILDADKAGFLRSETAIIQIVGRAARNENGKAILYAETVTGAMTRAIVATRRRRERQQEHNRRHGIAPRTIVKEALPREEVTKNEAQV